MLKVKSLKTTLWHVLCCNHWYPIFKHFTPRLCRTRRTDACYVEQMQSCAHIMRVTPQLLRNWKKNGGGGGWNYKKQKHYENPCNLFFVCLFFFLFSCIAKIYRTLEQFCPFLYKTISPWLEIRQWSHVVWKTNSHAVPNDESGTIWPRSASRVWNRFPSLPGSVLQLMPPCLSEPIPVCQH